MIYKDENQSSNHAWLIICDQDQLSVLSLVLCRLDLLCSMVQVLALWRKESGNCLNSQHGDMLLNLQPIKLERVDVLRDALKSVRIRLARLKTRSLSAFDTGMAIATGALDLTGCCTVSGQYSGTCLIRHLYNRNLPKSAKILWHRSFCHTN
jgi:hypothetical protein